MMNHFVYAAVGAVAILASAAGRADANAGLQVAGVAASASTAVQRAQPATPMHLAVIMRYRHEDELRALIAAEAIPGSPLAHHALSAAQFAAEFAPSPQDYASAIAALTRNGLRVTNTFTNRTVIDVAGPVSAVERTFATVMGAVPRADGSVRLINVRPAYAPAELAQTVYGVGGFDTGARSRSPRHPAGRASVPKVAPGPPLEGPKTGFGPEAFARAYDFPVLHAIPGAPAGTTYDGKSVGVALVANDDFYETDLYGFLAYFHITRRAPPTVRIRVDGGAQQDGIFSAITTMQAQTLVGTSPGIRLYDYGIPELDDAAMLDAYNHINSDDAVAVALSPAFDCEGATSARDFPQLSDYLALQGTALGIVYITNAGEYAEGTICPQFTPSGDPHFVSVGGTILLVDEQAHYRGEIASNDSAGGKSTIFGLPSYQRGVPGVTGKMRNIPDLSFDGDFYSGPALLEDHYWSDPSEYPLNESGNELASALFASMVAQWTQIHGSALGEMHGDLYAAYERLGYKRRAGMPVLHDITLGSGWTFLAAPGYDLATGIGSIDGWNYSLATGL